MLPVSWIPDAEVPAHTLLYLTFLKGSLVEARGKISLKLQAKGVVCHGTWQGGGRDFSSIAEVPESHIKTREHSQVAAQQKLHQTPVRAANIHLTSVPQKKEHFLRHPVASCGLWTTLGKICLLGSKGNNKVKTGSDFSMGLTRKLSVLCLSF